MSFYQRMTPSCPPGPNPWPYTRNGHPQDSEPPYAQDPSFYAAFTANPPHTLPAEHWPSLNNWIAHQNQMRLQEAKRRLANQLYSAIEVQDLRAAALRQLHMEEDEWAWQQQKRYYGFNGFYYPPAETGQGGEFTLGARYEESMQAGLHLLPPPAFVVYRGGAFVNGSGQVYAREVVYPIEGQGPREYYSVDHNGIGPSGENRSGTVPPVQQQYRDDIPSNAFPMPSSETAKVQSLGSADGLAAYVAELKSQMAEKINSGDFVLDASTAHGYQQYTRTPEFFKARRGDGTAQIQNHPTASDHSQVGELPEASEERMPNYLTTSGDARTPDLCNDQSQGSVNSLEHSPEEPIYRSPDVPAPKILAPQPTSPRSALLQMTSGSLRMVEENYQYQGYGVDSTEALHWQLPDWLWHQKSQEEGIMNGVSYDFNYPPRGYAATPEFVELHYGGEPDHHMSAEYHGEVDAPEEELNRDISTPAPRSPPEHHSGCTPSNFTDSQPPPCPQEPTRVPIDLMNVPIPPWPLINSQETSGTGCDAIPQEPVFEGFPLQQSLLMNFDGREAFMSDKAFNYFEKARPIRAPIMIPSELPALPVWPTPEPETPPSSPYPYSVDTPSPSVLVHKRHLKIRRAKLLAAQEQAMAAEAEYEEHQTDYTNAQQYRY
ncbi:hypothetical protein C7212DRAFT_362404 [Tuber magnatum]|uniref:Uncharacterized protein n=1 Tax=Tuber magnatum TaxID=42249 RepID=A0A317SUH3_9PEZI|nr:hypothetical protein C7212DRAFT_362404 [Tuber magnatum]